MKNSKSLSRQDRILKAFELHETLTIKQLIEMLQVSGWTVRRDLAQLEERQLIRRSYGKIELVDREDLRTYQQSLRVREEGALLVAKERIAKQVLRYLRSNTQVVMGAGTTTFACARQIKEHNVKLTIMTNALNIAIELTGLAHIELISTGGTAHGDYYTLNGPVAVRAIKSHNFDIAIIGVGGISVESGITVESHLNAEVLEAMINHSQWVIIVADHSKFGRVCFATLAQLDQIDMIVTDQTPDNRMIKHLTDHGVEIVVA